MPGRSGLVLVLVPRGARRESTAVVCGAICLRVGIRGASAQPATVGAVEGAGHAFVVVVRVHTAATPTLSPTQMMERARLLLAHEGAGPAAQPSVPRPPAESTTSSMLTWLRSWARPASERCSSGA